MLAYHQVKSDGLKHDEVKQGVVMANYTHGATPLHGPSPSPSRSPASARSHGWLQYGAAPSALVAHIGLGLSVVSASVHGDETAKRVRTSWHGAVLDGCSAATCSRAGQGRAGQGRAGRDMVGTGEIRDEGAKQTDAR
jgi:hypothetical protein